VLNLKHQRLMLRNQFSTLRIAIDLQPLCSDYALHGIGRYTRSGISALSAEAHGQCELLLVKRSDRLLYPKVEDWMKNHGYDKLVKELSFQPQGGFKEQCIE